MRKATEAELAHWDELIAANPDGGNALQTLAWGRFKGRWGWEPSHYAYDLPDGRLVAATWLKRNAGLGQTLWYCPKGPGVTTQVDFLEVVNQTRGQLKGVFARFEAEVLEDAVTPLQLAHERTRFAQTPFISQAAAALRPYGLVKANRDPGSKSTIFIDLSVGEEALLASFSQSTRRNIRKSEAAGVTVEPVEPTEANLEIMFELMKATEARAHYGLRPKAYFFDYWRAQIEAGQAQLLFTKHEGDVLAGIFVTYLGKRAWYKDGGSFAIKRELQPTYLMQWEVMRWLSAKGITSYDMVGVPNRDEVGKGDSRDGLYEFKSKFNPEITEFIGAYDLIGSPAAYKLWLTAGERLAARAAMKRPERFLY